MRLTCDERGRNGRRICTGNTESFASGDLCDWCTSLALVPVFQMVTNLPPFLGVLLGLVVLWFYTDIMYSKLHMHESNKLRISQLLPNIDLATIFFFLGILMAVGALETSGQLG